MQTLSMAAQSSNPANATSQKLNTMIAGGSRDYNSWRSLILEIETQSPEDINTISLAYDSFLSTFPLCHWHLAKYAHHKAKLCSPQEAVNIYEREVGVAMFSVGFWVDYFTFGAACFGDPEDVRRLFRRAVSFVDKDYFCHALWDKYMKYEFNLEGWSFLALSYIQVLRFPTKKLHFYYDNFKQFVANLEEETGYENNNGVVEQLSVHRAAAEISTDEISLVIKDLLDSSDRSVKSKALDRYRYIGEEFYQQACQVDGKLKCFEKKIQRRYFFATPLDDDQLNNWHLYLDFIEKQDNMDWAMKLYERCLIPCVNYPEFWMRYVEFLESKGGRELAISALNRATQIFLKNAPEIHLFNARFKEHIGDVSGARAALILGDTKTDSSFIENVVTLSNLERRLGNFAAASDTFKKALKNAREKRKIRVLPSLYFHFAQLTFLTTGSAAAARDVLIEGLQDLPHCRFLLEELIKFAVTHEGASQVNIIDPIIDNAISTGLDEYEGLSAKDRENISHLFLEFVNLCGTIHDIRRAWNRHIKLFPQFLRIKTTYKHSTSYSRDLERDHKGQEKVFEFPSNHEILPNQVPKRLSPQKDHGDNATETAQALSTKAVDLSNEDASEDNKPAYELSCKSKEDEPGPKESALSACDQDKSKQIDVSAELATQSRENTLSPHESAHEVRKSIVTTESILKESQSIPMSCDEYKIKRGVHVNFNYQSEGDGPASHQHSTPTNINADEDLIEIERVQDQHHTFYHDHLPANASDGKMPKQNPARQKSQLMDVQEVKKTDKAGPTRMTTPSIAISEARPPVSNQITSLSTQQPWQAQAMSQMLYHYHQQQQLLQQQYQQQLNMQNAYSQLQYNYSNQQPYQMQPHQQHYGQQPIPSYPQSQQNNQPMLGHLQLQQGQENFQQAHEKQYDQSQDLAYQAHLLAYQQQEQQLLLQQYQQYQGYQHQQQSMEGPSIIQEQPNSTHNLSQNQQGSRKTPPEYDTTVEFSESPHLRAQSPQQVLQ